MAGNGYQTVGQETPPGNAGMRLIDTFLTRFGPLLIFALQISGVISSHDRCHLYRNCDRLLHHQRAVRSRVREALGDLWKT
jgi:hypothetical protein